MKNKSTKRKPEEVGEHPSGLDIDPTQLDVEWRKQPMMVFKWARKVADARLIVTEAKQLMELTEAELTLKVRKDPQKYGLEKPTEASISAVVIRQPEYKDCQNYLNGANYDLDVLQGYMAALEHRKKALEGNVSLEMIQYRSEPQAKGTREEVEHVEKVIARKATKRRVDDD